MKEYHDETVRKFLVFELKVFKSCQKNSTGSSMIILEMWYYRSISGNKKQHPVHMTTTNLLQIHIFFMSAGEDRLS